jgi:hypothetical protein
MYLKAPTDLSLALYCSFPKNPQLVELTKSFEEQVDSDCIIAHFVSCNALLVLMLLQGMHSDTYRCYCRHKHCEAYSR